MISKRSSKSHIFCFFSSQCRNQQKLNSAQASIVMHTKALLVRNVPDGAKKQSPHLHNWFRWMKVVGRGGLEPTTKGL
jgi:hypothetical protein